MESTGHLDRYVTDPSGIQDGLQNICHVNLVNDQLAMHFPVGASLQKELCNKSDVRLSPLLDCTGHLSHINLENDLVHHRFASGSVVSASSWYGLLLTTFIEGSEFLLCSPMLMAK